MTLIRRLILALALAASIAPASAQAPPPVPGLPDTERRTTYSISASTCACAVGFQLYGDSTDTANWLEVFINGVQVSGWTVTSPTGSLATIARPITDAVLTFTVPQTGTVQIVGARRPRRVSQFSENRGVAARDLNQVLTDIIAQNREIWDKTNDVTGRAVLAPPGESLKLLPALASRQNMGACFDSGGNLQPCVAASGSFIAGTGITFTGTNPTTISTPPIVGTAIRQAILSSSVDGAGTANFAAPGSGLNVNLTATAVPFIASFAAGFGTSGNVDFVGQLSADALSYWPNLPASQYSFLSIDRNTSTFALTPTQTLMRPQRGPAYYQPIQALLHLTASVLDDGGNSWATSGASFVGAIAGFGSGAVSLNGLGSYVQTTSIHNPGQGAFTMETVVKFPTTNNAQSIFSVGQAYGVYVVTDASGHLQLFLSSGGNNNGASGSGTATCAATTCWDIANGLLGATVATTGAAHHVRLTYDQVNYRLSLDGVVQITVPSTTVVWPDGAAMAIGAQVGVASTTAAIFQEFSFVPFARSVGNFTPPTSAYTISGDWFDTNQMLMKTISGPGPTFTTIQRLYVAEAQTGVASVSAVYDYSPTRQYAGADFSMDGAGKLRVGNHVIYAEGTPQFITSSTPGTPCVTVPACTINTPVTWVMTPSQVPPDAKWFDVQINVFHAAIGGTNPGNQDCTLQSRIPVGTAQGFVALGAAYSNFTGFGSITNTTAFTEGAGAIVRYPVINGVAAFETSIGGGTCLTGGTNNQARIVSGILIGYDMP